MELLEPIVAVHVSRVTACFVVPEDADERQEQDARSWINWTLRHAKLGDVERRIIKSKSIPAGIARTGADYDLVVMGAGNAGLFQQLVFGEVPDLVGRYTNTSVMLVKRREGPTKAWLKRVMS